MSEFRKVSEELKGLDLAMEGLVVGWLTADALKSTEMRRVTATKEVAGILAEAARSTAKQLSAALPIAYTPDLELDEGQVAEVDRDQLNPGSSLLGKLEADSHESFQKDHFKKVLSLYAVLMSAGERRFAFVYRRNPRRSLGAGVMTFFNDRLRLQQSPILSFDEGPADLVLEVGHGAAVLSIRAFEWLFRDSPELLARTPDAVRQLSQSVMIDLQLLEELEVAAIRNSRVRTRLFAINQRGHLAGLTTVQIEKALLEHNLDPDVHLVDGRLTFPGGLAELLIFLNEDLAKGSLSQAQYTILRKSPRR